MEELHRPTSGLLISGLIAGTIVGLSLMLMGVMQTLAGEVHEFWRVAIEANAYAAGFIIIMARTDLFTEYTTIATLPLLTGNARTSSVARLWGIIYAANLAGGAVFALLLWYIGPALGILQLDVFARKALQLAQQPWTIILASAFVTGWLMGLLAWLVVAVRDSISQVFFIWLIAAIIAFSQSNAATFLLPGQIAPHPGPLPGERGKIPLDVLLSPFLPERGKKRVKSAAFSPSPPGSGPG